MPSLNEKNNDYAGQCREHYEKICWSIALTVWEWLKIDMLHLTHDT